MSVLSDDVYLDQFGTWLADLGKDVGALAELLRVNAEHESAKSIAGGLNYVFKSLDLIPDGIDDLGYLDDAFVLRVAALHARQAGLTGEALERFWHKTLIALSRMSLRSKPAVLVVVRSNRFSATVRCEAPFWESFRSGPSSIKCRVLPSTARPS
jgi:uncharacterized membrane protein YkvA (DUF1232 family)